MPVRNQDGPREAPPPEDRRGPGRSDPPAESLARAVWEDVRSGATHFGHRQVPAPRHPVRQFFHGLFLPFHVAGALWADPSARRRFLKVGLFQSVAIVGLGLALLLFSADTVRDVAQEHGVRLRISPAQQKGTRFSVTVSNDDSEDTEDSDAADEADAPDEDTVERPAASSFSVRMLAFWAALFAAVQTAQWIVIALSRDFHDMVSRDASLLIGIKPEDEQMTPRVRINFRWLRNKFSRRIRGFMIFAVALPLLYTLSLPFPSHHTVASVLISAWSAYWLVVFTASKTAYAWTNEQAGPPWFLRGWDWLGTRIPLFRWKVLAGYGRFWTRHTRSVFSPAAEMEKQPWAFAGLALTRMLSMIPLVKCFLRPLIPVASAHLILSRSAAEAPPSADAPTREPAPVDSTPSSAT